MPFRTRRLALALGGATALIALAPAIAQRSPESILPPGFGEPAAPPPPAAPATPGQPAEQPPTPLIDNGAIAAPEEATADSTLDNAAAPVEVYDLPAEARRSLDRVGLLAEGAGGLGAGAFGGSDGRYLTSLMRNLNAPIASRWASILLRRALLSQSATPTGIGGADWVAERTWLLVRMGEADDARTLAQRVDSDNYTPWLYEATMQAALASADPAALCGIADAGAAQGGKAAWLLAQAMCAGLSGEGGTASSLIAQARQTRGVGGIDVLLAEKVAGAGTNTRRAITIQWDGVDQLTAWRYGLATATGVAIPAELFATVGPQVQAWAARAPLFDPAMRLAEADRAATLGVFSSAALADLYGQVYDATDPSDRGGTPADALRSAYSGASGARLSALRGIWSGNDDNPLRGYA
nr:hypothetical protein [Sphingomonadaceae bacterium]